MSNLVRYASRPQLTVHTLTRNLGSVVEVLFGGGVYNLESTFCYIIHSEQHRLGLHAAYSTSSVGSCGVCGEVLRKDYKTVIEHARRHEYIAEAVAYDHLRPIAFLNDVSMSESDLRQAGFAVIDGVVLGPRALEQLFRSPHLTWQTKHSAFKRCREEPDFYSAMEACADVDTPTLDAFLATHFPTL